VGHDPFFDRAFIEWIAFLLGKLIELALRVLQHLLLVGVVKLLKSRMQAIEGGHSVARKDLRSRMRSALAMEVPARRSRRGSIPLPIESAKKKTDTLE
jgi:hypothetical protein